MCNIEIVKENFMHSVSRNLFSLIAAGTLVAGVAFAQDASTDSTKTAVEQKSVTKHKGPGPNTKTKTHTMTGVVKEYEAGKNIEITTAKNKDEKIDLTDKDLTATISPDVAVGKKVKAVEKTDDNGKKTLTIEPMTAKTTHHHHKKAA
jgi:hypothetical protein